MGKITITYIKMAQESTDFTEILIKHLRSIIKRKKMFDSGLETGEINILVQALT